MSNLTFVGLSDDGAALILSSPQGDRFRLAIDERLRSAVRSGRAQLAAVDGPIGAKEIQARLRAGATQCVSVTLLAPCIYRPEFQYRLRSDC